MNSYDQVAQGLGGMHANFQNNTAGDIANGAAAGPTITDANGAIPTRLMLKELVDNQQTAAYGILNGTEATPVNMDNSNGGNVGCGLNRAFLKLAT